MALSELQRIIVGGLKLCGLSDAEIVQALITLKTEEQQWVAADYLEDIIDAPSSQKVMQMMQTIAKL